MSRSEANTHIIFSQEIKLRMNEFKEELLQLLLRYGSPNINSNNKASETFAKLTNQQITEIIQEVMREMFKINLQNMKDASLKTPANDIIITTPNAPDVLRVDYNQNNTFQTRYKFLEALGKEYDDNYLKSCNLSSLSNYSDEMTEISDKRISITETDTTKIKKARNELIIPKLKQGLNTTYIRGAMLKKIKQDMPRIGSATNITMYMVEEAYKNATKVTKKLEDLKELLTSETKSSLRLSSIMRLPIPNHQQHHHQQQTAASIQRSKVLRRYVQQAGSDAPVTPTSSRPSLVPPQPLPPPKKSIPRPVNKHTLNQHNRTLAESNKSTTTRSPSKTQSRNAKYSHVQSTIPKPSGSLVKRKAQ